MSAYNFNANEVAPDPGMIVLPDDWYDLVIVKPPVYEPTNDGKGRKISAEITVASGPYKGRIVFHTFNVENPIEKTQTIGKAQLSALSHAVGNLVWTDTAQLCNVVWRGKVGIEAAQNGYQEKNKMFAFKHMQDPTAGKSKGPTAAAPAARPPTAPPQAPPPAATGAGDWAAAQAAALAIQQAQAAAPPPVQQAPVQAAPPAEAPAWQPSPQAWDPAALAEVAAPPVQAPPPQQPPPVQTAPPPQAAPADLPPWVTPGQ
jgi:hypothetical protein